MTDSGGARRLSYDIDGLARISSAVRLPELELFRVAAVEQPDLVIERRAVVSGTPERRDLPTYFYRERLGSVTANFNVELGPPVRVLATPLLAHSPHVLYTNIVEPLLRFVIAGRGRMLLHAGCVSLFGQGIMLSAKTDTGKTATILRLLRECRGTFLSDDMTIIGPDGAASRFPKPLTISAHTLKAVAASPLPAHRRAALSVQSRLHSRSGRSVGKWLGERPLPIMAMNSLVQAVIPPPKYMVQQLVPAEMGRTVQVRRLFLIERGSPALAVGVGRDEAVEQLLSNTADAYEFPPFKTMAPQLTVGGLDFAAVQEAERRVLTAALSSMEVVRLRVADFSWPSLVRAAVAPGEFGGPANGHLDGPQRDGSRAPSRRLPVPEEAQP